MDNQLPILYEARGRELKRMEQELENLKSSNGQEIRSLRHEVAILKGDQDRITACMENYKDTAESQSEENRRIRDGAETLKVQLASSEKLKLQLENELDSANHTLEQLHSQLMELQQSDTILKAKQSHEEVVSSLRERHEKELFRLHQEIDKYKAEAKSKDINFTAEQTKMRKIQSDYDILQIEKSDTIQAYQVRLEDAQKRLQQNISETASFNYTNVRAIEQRAREDKEKYAQELLRFRDKDEECVLLNKNVTDIRSKYASLKQKVCKYQEHQRRKEQKYLEQIRQTQEDCHARLLEVKLKTKEAVESKNKQYQEEVLQMQKLFDVEMEKVTNLTLKCSANVLGRETLENDFNEYYSPHQQRAEINIPSSANQNPMKEHTTNWDNNEKENYFPPGNYLTNQNTFQKNDMAASQSQRPPMPNQRGNTNSLKTTEPSTENLKRVIT